MIGAKTPRKRKRGHILPEKISPRAFFDELGDGLHPLRSRVLTKNATIKKKGHNNGNAPNQRPNEPTLPKRVHIASSTKSEASFSLLPVSLKPKGEKTLQGAR